MSRGSMADRRRSSLRDRDGRRGDELARLPQLLFRTETVEARSLAFALAGAKYFNQAFHVTRMCLGRLESGLLRGKPCDGSHGVRSQHPQACVPFGFRGSGRGDSGSRQRGARAEDRQRLLDLQKLREARALPAVHHSGIRVRQPGELLTARDLRLRADGSRLRTIAHDQLHDFALGSVLGHGQRWHDQAESSDPGTHLGSGRHKTVLDCSN